MGRLGPTERDEGAFKALQLVLAADEVLTGVKNVRGPVLVFPATGRAAFGSIVD